MWTRKHALTPITHNAPGFSNLMVHHSVKSYFPLLPSKTCTQSFNPGRRWALGRDLRAEAADKQRIKSGLQRPPGWQPWYLGAPGTVERGCVCGRSSWARLLSCLGTEDVSLGIPVKQTQIRVLRSTRENSEQKSGGKQAIFQEHVSSLP